MFLSGGYMLMFKVKFYIASIYVVYKSLREIDIKVYLFPFSKLITKRENRLRDVQYVI